MNVRVFETRVLRHEWLRSALRRRRFGVVITALIATPGVVVGQNAQPPAFAAEASWVAATALEATAVEVATGFGFSRAVRLLIAEAGEPLDSAILQATVGDWRRGHRWSRLDGRATRILGVPVETSADQAPDLEPMDQPDVILAPPTPGLWRLETAGGGMLAVATLVPAGLSRNGRLNGYHIGTYPTAGSGRLDSYAPPAGFIEVTPDMVDIRVSEHFAIGQFLTKDQVDIWPKYLALDLRLIDKLELVIQELNAMGIRAHRAHVMSGFRTPQYNGPGGDGRAALSRHMWGDAADLWIDDIGTGEMDDLNGDGRVDINDAAAIMRAVERVERRYPELVGGAGLYPTTDSHGPYIHIDARGTRTRW